MYVPGASCLAGAGWVVLLLVEDMTHGDLPTDGMLGTKLALVVSHVARSVWAFRRR